MAVLRTFPSHLMHVFNERSLPSGNQDFLPLKWTSVILIQYLSSLPVQKLADCIKAAIRLWESAFNVCISHCGNICRIKLGLFWRHSLSVQFTSPNIFIKLFNSFSVCISPTCYKSRPTCISLWIIVQFVMKAKYGTHGNMGQSVTRRSIITYLCFVPTILHIVVL